jgi:hypothetical protein
LEGSAGREGQEGGQARSSRGRLAPCAGSGLRPAPTTCPRCSASACSARLRASASPPASPPPGPPELPASPAPSGARPPGSAASRPCSAASCSEASAARLGQGQGGEGQRERGSGGRGACGTLCSGCGTSGAAAVRGPLGPLFPASLPSSLPPSRTPPRWPAGAAPEADRTRRRGAARSRPLPRSGCTGTRLAAQADTAAGQRGGWASLQQPATRVPTTALLRHHLLNRTPLLPRPPLRTRGQAGQLRQLRAPLRLWQRGEARHGRHGEHALQRRAQLGRTRGAGRRTHARLRGAARASRPAVGPSAHPPPRSAGLRVGLPPAATPPGRRCPPPKADLHLGVRGGLRHRQLHARLHRHRLQHQLVELIIRVRRVAAQRAGARHGCGAGTEARRGRRTARPYASIRDGPVRHHPTVTHAQARRAGPAAGGSVTARGAPRCSMPERSSFSAASLSTTSRCALYASSMSTCAAAPDPQHGSCRLSVSQHGSWPLQPCR